MNQCQKIIQGHKIFELLTLIYNSTLQKKNGKYNTFVVNEIIITLMFPSILCFATNLRSSSSGDKGSQESNSEVALERFSNSARHLFNNNNRKVQGLGGFSKLGA